MAHHNPHPSSYADRLDPVPEALIPQFIQHHEGEVNLFKDEYRAVQRLRQVEHVFIPEVVRSTHPPEAGPQGVASHPAPSYVTAGAGSSRPDSGKRAVGISNVARPVSAAKRRSLGAFAGKYDWAEREMNTPGVDYVPMRAAPAHTPGAGGQRRFSERPTSALDASIKARVQSGTLASARGATSSRAALGHHHHPRVSSPGPDAHSHRRPASPPLGRRLSSGSDFIMDVDASEGLQWGNQLTSVPRVARPLMSATTHQRAGEVEVVSNQTAMDTLQHIRDAASSIRKYSPAAHKPATSTLATTYARPPQSAHKHHPLQPTPSERIASNFSPSARGLSPRLIEHLSPGGIRTDASEPLPGLSRSMLQSWGGGGGAGGAGEGSPEADGILTAAKKHMSFLPLEIFDNQDLETRTPEEWVELGRAQQGTPAETLLYRLQEDRYVWSPCSVQRWDPTQRAFEVLLGTGKSKIVKRLNLRFQAEDQGAFHRRIADAKASREEVEAHLRAVIYIDSLAVEEVLETYNFQGAVEDAAGACRQLRAAVLDAHSQLLAAEAKASYTRAVRQAILDYRRLDPYEEGRLQVLRLPPLPPPPAVPYSGVMEVCPPNSRRMYDFEQLRAWAPAQLYHSSEVMLPMLQTLQRLCLAMEQQLLWCFSERDPEFQALEHVERFTLEDAGPAPYPVPTFEALQHCHVTKVMHHLHLKLLEALSAATDESVVAALNGGSLLGVHDHSPVHAALLKCAALKVENSLHSLLLGSAAAYCKYMEGYEDATPKGFYTGLEEVWNKRPLLIIRLAEVGGLPALVPGIEEILDVACGLFDEMAAKLGELPDVFVGRGTTEGVRRLCGGNWAQDERLQGYRNSVYNVVERGVERAVEIGSLFEAAAGILAEPVETVLAKFEGREVALQEYASLIGQFQSAAAAAANASHNEVHTGLVVVDCAPLKAALAAKASTLVHAVLQHLAGQCSALSLHICSRCSYISERVAIVSADTREVLALQADLEKYEDELDQLKAMAALNKDRDTFLAAYRQLLPEHHFQEGTAAHVWVRDMPEVLTRAHLKANKEHLGFQHSLKSRAGQLQAAVEDVKGAIAVYNLLTDTKEQLDHADLGAKLQAKLADLEAEVGVINEEEALFGWAPASSYPLLEQLVAELEPHASLWHITAEFTAAYDAWMYGSFKDMDPEEIEALNGEWLKKMLKLSKTLDNPKLKTLAENMKIKLEEFRSHVPIITCICNPGMRMRHWEALSAAANFSINPATEGVNLAYLLKHNLKDLESQLQDISDVASREYALEKQLDKMQAEWNGLKFEVLSWKDTGGHILKGAVVEEALMLLDDHTVKAQAMLSSPAAKPFIDRIGGWVRKLQAMGEIFDAWLKCQQMWMFLGPVYGSEEIAKHMPKERREFQAADAKWRLIMGGVVRNPDIMSTTDQEGLLMDLQGCNKSFAVIERSLNAFLDTKKLAFPRFFFLSNDELLEILSETKDPLNVQPYVKKCFEAVRELEFQEDLSISAMVSLEGERIPLDTPVQAGGDHNGVERWLLALEGAMRKSLHTITCAAVQAYPTRHREKWVLEWPGQVVLAVGQVYWTAAVVEAIHEGGYSALQRLTNQCTTHLQQEVMLVRGELSALERCTIGALVVVDVHARDVVQEMVDDKVYTESDFSWQARLRYYWEKDDLTVRMLNAHCAYGYEYLGNTGRLVITPLTDRCYRTLLGAHHMNLGGAPAGPAGTGKTETVKDLAKAVAIQCVVFNCSDGLDYIAMGKFFKGLAASGAFACFDEFNRIELEVLSVVAQQVLTIQRAKAAGKKRFVFEGVDLPLLPTCNIFITMNPGYAGRSELPDNLKALFRDVAMMVPDYAMIAEIILYSFGYLDARSLAQKLVQAYRLCSEQLSRQDHYDYGMRAVMAVLRAAGNLKRKWPEEKEAVLMLRAINDVNLPKFLDEDVPLFRGILSDLFPGVALPQVDYSDLIAALSANAARSGLQPLPAFLEKAIQLYEMILVRHGLMLVGQSFGMKTSAVRTLAAALGDLCAEDKNEFKVKVTTINPKSVTLGQLYGQDDPVSKEWTDGVLALAFRNAARDTSPDRKWLVLDGPVDAIWIENMNTVLDDNKKLCCNSGEIIAMQGLMSLIFEVADLAVASPATVSRCGMVYVQPSLLGWRPLLQSWMASLPDTYNREYKKLILEMFEWLVPPTLRLVTRGCHMPVPMQDINLVQSLLRLYHCLLLDSKAGLASNPLLYLESTFIFACIWSLGGAVDTAGREHFSTHFRSFLADKYDDAYKPWASGPARKLAKTFPKHHTVYDWYFSTGGGKWQPWMDSVKGQRVPTDVQYSSIIVSTVDVVRYTYLIQILVANHLPLLLVGPTGTGKTTYMQRHLATLDRKAWLPLLFNFSAQTSANTTQDIIDGKLEKRRKGIYGPAVGRRAVVFVDDLNMPQVEQYGAQPPVELLRQFMDHGGWYDREELSMRHLVDTHFVAAMGPPGGGRNPVTNRYLRHFHVLFVTEFGAESKTQIFTALVDWWFARCKYEDDISLYRDNLVAASLEVYSAAVQELLPTPAKTHYTFNLRDLSKVFQGMQEAGSNLTDSDSLVRLWVHEVMRVFHDRLVDDADRSWLVAQLRTTSEAHFHVKFNKLLGRVANEAGQVGVAEMRQLMFVEFLAGGGLPHYEEATDVTRLAAVVEEQLAAFNAGSKAPMRLVLFLYALEHVARVCRILRQPAGHALLVGVGGSGRQSLTRLAAFIMEFQVFQIELSSSYSRGDWQDDLRRALRAAGEKGKPTVFLFSDSQILEEAMVEDISNLLNTAEVPNLFDVGDVIAITEGVRAKAKVAKVPDTRQDMYDFFVKQVRSNLHVVLCFSPVGDAFRERLRKFPSLTTCTTIDWFTAWPDDALRSVADRGLQDLDAPERLKPKLAEQCMLFHRSVRELTERYAKEARRHFYVTPTSYLQLLDTFRGVLRRRQAEVQAAQRRYEGGLQKLAATEVQVKAMQRELEGLKPQLIVSGQETAKLMKVIEKETREADKVKLVVQVEERKASQEASKVAAIKAECEADLAQAMPAYTASIRALDTLTKNDVSEVKGMKNPPLPVKLVMEAVCLLKGLKPTRFKDKATGQWVVDWWETSKRVLSDMYFLDSLKTYDKDNIAPEVMEAVKPYLAKADFQPAKMRQVSQAASGLCAWVRAMETYDRVAKVVRPKRAALKEAEGQLAVVMQALKLKQDALKEVEDKLAALGAQLEAATARKAGLEGEVGVCEEKLDRASKLTGGLGGEKARWTEAAAALGEQQVSLVGDMLLASGVIAYLGAFTAEYRAQALAQWQGQMAERALPCSPAFSLVKALGDPVQLRSWNIWGLPKDDFSAANGIIVTQTKRWPLCIDPQRQALKWITAMEAGNQLVVLKAASPGYLRQLEAAIGLGRPVLLAGVGEAMDAALAPVLLQQTFKQGGMLCIKLGENVVSWAPGFKLYMATKLRSPHYPPEVCTRVCIVNFSITPTGLQEQLLGLTVAKEQPDLEREKNELILQGAENKRKLAEIEERILAVLEASQGNILEDGAAVTVLQESKTLADEIARRQKEAERTEAAIDNARVAYDPVARHASVLFFCVAELVNIDPMYQYSLAYFMQLFARSVDDSPPTPSLPKRLASLRQHFTHYLFTCICRSLFQKDRLLLAFSLTTSLAMADGSLDLPLLKFLLAGGISMAAPQPNPAKEWLPDKRWADVCTLDALAPPFAGVKDSIAGDPDGWRLELAGSKVPPLQQLLEPYATALTPFQKLLLLRCLAPDKLISAIQAYVVGELGPEFVEPQPLQLGPAFTDSSASVPLIFVLGQGSDPMADLLQFAEEKHRQVETVSLGQGQGPHAEQWVREAARAGFWVVLQNCHLAASFLPRLEALCEELLHAPSTHPEFRLWLTSYPTPIFPISVLEGGLKMTYELPSGLRAGLERAYRSDPLAERAFLEGCGNQAAFKCLAYSLAFFHAVVTGRKQYGPVGWNIPYSFNENDLRISMRQLRLFLDTYDEVPLPMLRYTAGECNYGGKVTDAQDRLTLTTLLDAFYTDSALLPGFHLAAGAPYTIPKIGPHAHYLQHISTLPLTEPPEVFGLHPNAAISRDLQATRTLLDSLLLTLPQAPPSTPRAAAPHAGDPTASPLETPEASEEASPSAPSPPPLGPPSTPEDSIHSIASEILAQLPGDFNMEEAAAKYPVAYLESMNTVLVQELGRVNALLRAIRSSLEEVRLAVRGRVVMSADLERLATALLNGKVPEMWAAKSFPSLKPLGPYCAELLERTAFFASWLQQGAPAAFWLPAFFFTQAFLTGVKQNFARRHRIPIDLIDFAFTVMDGPHPSTLPAPADGAYVTGMYLEAACWDPTTHLLTESRPQQLHAPMPPMHFLPTQLPQGSAGAAGGLGGGEGGYLCPLYKTSERRGVLSTTGHSTNYVMGVRVPSALPAAHWIKRGAAMLTCLDT